jgi:hypothetical protein
MIGLHCELGVEHTSGTVWNIMFWTSARILLFATFKLGEFTLRKCLALGMTSCEGGNVDGVWNIIYKSTAADTAPVRNFEFMPDNYVVDKISSLVINTSLDE